MHLHPTIVLAALLFISSSAAPALAEGDSSQALSQRLMAAIKSQDLKAASELVEWGEAPAPAYRMFKMNVIDCYAPAECSIKIFPISEKEKKASDGSFYFPVAPEGSLTIIPKGQKSGLSLPFAKIGEHYKIIIGQLTKAGYEQLRALANARKLAEELDPDIVSAGTQLPADGGEPAKAYLEYVAAVARGDVEYLANRGSQGDRYYFAKAYATNPAKKAVSLEVAKMENIPSPIIAGGFIKEERALLLVTGQSGQGWNTEGAVTLQRRGGQWSVEDKRYVSFAAIK